MSESKKGSNFKDSFIFRFLECLILQVIKIGIGFGVYLGGSHFTNIKWASDIKVYGEFQLRYAVEVVVDKITRGKVQWLHESVTASSSYGVYCWIMIGLALFLTLMCIWSVCSLFKGLSCITLNVCTECPNYLSCRKMWKVERKY